MLGNKCIPTLSPALNPDLIPALIPSPARLVLGNKCIHMRCVALIDPSPPVNIGDGDSEAEQSQPKLYFKVASKTFFFHFSRFVLVVRVLGLAFRD